MPIEKTKWNFLNFQNEKPKLGYIWIVNRTRVDGTIDAVLVRISVNIVVVNFAAMTLNVICVLSSRSKLSCYRFNAKLCYTQQLLISNNSRMWNSLLNGFDCYFELIEGSWIKKTQIYWLTQRFMSVQQFLDSLIGISNPRRDERGCSTANQ